MENTYLLNNRRYIAQHNYNSTFYDLLIYILGLLCITTLFTATFEYSSLVNRILMAIYMLISVILIFLNLRQWVFFVILSLSALIIIDLAFTETNLYNLNDLFYLPLWIINLMLFSLKNQEIKKHLFARSFFLKTIIFIWSFLVLISMFFPSSYVLSDSGKSFVSFCGTQHRFAATALFIIVCAMLLYNSSNKRRYVLLTILPLVAILMTDARTYIIVALVTTLFILLRVVNSKHLRRFLFFVSVFIIIYAGLYFTTVRMSVDSYGWQVSTYGSLHFITSGRSTFWQIDLEHFFESNFINILFGRGYNFVYDVNKTFYNGAIWAHNDYINVLLANGILGLVLYLATFIYFLREILRKCNFKVIFLLMYVFIIFFNAMFNMVYSYTVANILTPILGLIMLESEASRPSKRINKIMKSSI